MIRRTVKENTVIPFLIILAVVVVVGGLVWAFQLNRPSDTLPKSAQPRSADNKPSVFSMQANSFAFNEETSNLDKGTLAVTEDGAIKHTHAMLKIKINGKEEVLDISQGVPEEIVQKLADATHMSPNAVREMVAGRFNQTPLQNVPTQTTLKIKIDGKEETMDVSAGATDANVDELVSLARVTPEQARHILSGHLDEGDLKNLSSTIGYAEFRLEKHAKAQWKFKV